LASGRADALAQHEAALEVEVAADEFNDRPIVVDDEDQLH